MTIRSAGLLILAALMTGNAPTTWGQSAAGADQKEESKDTKNQSTPDTVQPAADASTYKIGAQDVLKIDVWREDQLTRTVPVRPDGKISLPLLNDVQAVGLTPMELANAIREELKKYITNPQVTVTVAEINSKRIYVTGEVTKAGAYQLLPHMTVLQALSGSGGFTAFARIKNIYILRTENGKPTRVPFNYKQAIKGKNAEQNIELQSGDVVVVP